MSCFYEFLSNRVSFLKHTFLDPINSGDALENSDSNNQDYIRAFILLCHAELERYFETVAIAVVKSSSDVYENRGIVTPQLACLLGVSRLEIDLKENASLPIIIARVVTLYFAKVKNNNGIKERNLVDFLYPIGFTFDDITQDLFLKLDNYGRQRGIIAHTGTSGDNLLSAIDELKNIDNILHMLEAFDNKIDALPFVDSSYTCENIIRILAK